MRAERIVELIVKIAFGADVRTNLFAKGTIAVPLVWLCALSAYAQTAGAPTAKTKPVPGTVEQLEVTDYGIYTANKTASVTNDKGLTHNTVNNIQYIAATRTIRAHPGIKFGFRYMILGRPEDARVTIRQVTLFPPQGITSPKTGLLHDHSFSAVYRIGMSGIFAGYDVDEPWELVPGKWTIQLWVDDRKLAEESFALVIPQEPSN